MNFRSPILAAPVVVAGAALATTITQELRSCPVCGEAVEVLLPLSTNTFGGQDRDLLARASGTQVFLVVVRTCGKCGFTGYPDDFLQGAPEPLPVAPEKRSRKKTKEPEPSPPAPTPEAAASTLPPAVVHAILDEKRLVVPAGLPRPDGEHAFADLPAWARYDLLGQTVSLQEVGNDVLADIHLQAAWAVRMEAPVPILPPGGEWLRDRATTLREEGRVAGMLNPADVDTWLGARLVLDAASAPAEQRCASLTGGVTRLRGHGEHDAVLAALPALGDCPDVGWTDLERSIDLERSYQRRSRDELLVALSNREMPADALVYAGYLLGELERRLGETGSAVSRFDTLLATGSLPEGLAAVAREQRCLAATGNDAGALVTCRSVALQGG